MTMTNVDNRRIYRHWARVYDPVTGWFFAQGRQRAVSLLKTRPGDRVLLVGVGTGADVPLLPGSVQAVGLDLSREMLRHACSKPVASGLILTLMQGDAGRLPFAGASFDAAILSLVLSVVPDGAACLSETLRVVRPGCRVVIFDKFLPDNGSISPPRRLINQITTRFGTDINRRFETIHISTQSMIIRREPSILGGMYQVIVLERR